MGSCTSAKHNPNNRPVAQAGKTSQGNYVASSKSNISIIQ